ncbi:ABC transporter ATP-binding protein [Sediminibacillus halophilus]|uniref:Putative ABC transport system ATP-binding protein n=1 Tax=Sediminibacillus halophilus TaxID=482461 RepID=A0A1G9UXQ2_9BACI|nr:ABC transporter ATP-binding protein [Sediminibacillus halophilus]SDM64640.1 putative ABC transport system ATP-binding protein [Sediminibacillus halophilus]
MTIELHNVSVTFDGVEKVEAIKNISLTIDHKECLAILGPSGSGKTTLLNVIGGMLPLTNGEIFVDGQAIHRLTASELQTFRRTKIGYIFQDYRLFDQFTVLENVMLPQWPYDSKKTNEEKARGLLEDLQISHREKAFPSLLSGGEKQRVAIARAMLHQPDILLCDEPTGNLDADNRNNVMEIIEEIRKQGITIIIVTHDQEVAKRGTRELFIRDGELASG